MADLTQPTTPFREESIDHADPREWARDPSPANLDRLPKRPVTRVRAEVDIEKKTRLLHDGQHPIVRKQQRPELFRRYFSGDMIRMAQAGQPPPAEFETWIREIIEPGVVENLRGQFAMAIDPAFRRWTLYQRVQTRSDGEAYARLCVFAGAARPGYIPPDLDGDPRFGHLRGAIGDFKVPTRRDFEEIREKWDRRSIQGQESSIRAGATSINNRLNREQAAEYDEHNRVMNDAVYDMLTYNYRAINQAANNGTKQWSNETIVPHMNPERHQITQREGYIAKAKKGSRFAAMLEAEAAERAKAAEPVTLTDAEREDLRRELAVDVAREAHLAKARALIRGRAVETKRRKTL